MIDSRQHAESTTLHTTLPRSSSSWQHHVCAHGVSSLCCGELFISEPVTCHPTISYISAVLPLHAHAHRTRHGFHNIPGVEVSASPIPVYVRKTWKALRLGNQLFPRVIFQFFLRRSQMTDSRQHLRRAQRYNPAAQQQQQATPCMCAWRFLDMLRQGVCVGACYLSPHHSTYFCCAAAACAFPKHVHRSRHFGRK